MTANAMHVPRATAKHVIAPGGYQFVTLDWASLSFDFTPLRSRMTRTAKTARDRTFPTFSRFGLRSATGGTETGRIQVAFPLPWAAKNRHGVSDACRHADARRERTPPGVKCVQLIGPRPGRRPPRRVLSGRQGTEAVRGVSRPASERVLRRARDGDGANPGAGHEDWSEACLRAGRSAGSTMLINGVPGADKTTMTYKLQEE